MTETQELLDTADDIEQEEKTRLFNESFEHIKQQGAPALNGSLCAYRTNDGKMCAAGPFIKDYDSEEMENRPFDIIAEKYPDKVDPVAVKHKLFVNDLQKIHDDAADVCYRRVEDGDDEGLNDALFMDIYRYGMRNFARWCQIIPSFA